VSVESWKGFVFSWGHVGAGPRWRKGAAVGYRWPMQWVVRRFVGSLVVRFEEMTATVCVSQVRKGSPVKALSRKFLLACVQRLCSCFQSFLVPSDLDVCCELGDGTGGLLCENKAREWK